MKVETERVLQALAPPGEARWPLTAAWMLVLIAALLVAYRDTAESMLALWTTSDTYAHGYLVVPIALFLIWRRRDALARTAPRPDWLGFVLLGAAGFAWLAAAAGQVQVVQHYAMTAMLPALVVALAGRRAAWQIAFPLAFLLLAVPFGEAFLPRMMDWTADFTVGALRATGIPVYRDGTFFTIPSGQWSVVEACSGLRYLIASLTVGALFAYLNYRRWWKRAAFLALSIAVPIVANFVRAYLIVMIGHLSDMKLAVGADHFLYGWVFFGIVILLLFWLGSFWRDHDAPAERMVYVSGRSSPSGRVITGTALGAVAVVLVWPLYAAQLERPRADPAPVLAVPAGVAGWTTDGGAALDWRPRYSGAAASLLQGYRKGEQGVAVYVGVYRGERPDAKLVTSMNGVDSPPRWVRVASSSVTEELGRGPVRLRATHLRGARSRLLVWEWFSIGGYELANPYFAKALLARDKLLGRDSTSAVLIVAAPYDTQPQAAAESLRAFMREMRPSVDRAIGEAK